MLVAVLWEKFGRRLDACVTETLVVGFADAGENTVRQIPGGPKPLTLNRLHHSSGSEKKLRMQRACPAASKSIVPIFTKRSG